MKTFLKILLAALLLMPALALATTSAPWSITNLTDTFIFPNLINGSAKGVLVSASSTFNGNLSVSTLTSGNCVQAGAGGLLTTVVGACGSGTGSTFGTTSLSAVAPLQYSQSPLAQFSITQAGTGGNGYLSSVDFNTFNNKISSTSLSVTTTGTSGAATYTPATGVFNIPQYATAPGGLNTQVQYNNAGVFGGVSGATTNGTILSLTNALLGGATLTTSVVNGVTLSSAGSATTYLNGTGAYSVPVGTVYTGTFPIQVTGSVISSLFSTTTNSGLAAGNLYVGSGGIFQTSASSSIFGFTPVAPTRAINTTYPLQGGGDLSADRTLTFGGLGTTSPWTQGQLAYVVNGNTLTSTATTSVTCTGNASCSPFAVLGASPITINVAAGTAASSTLLGDSNTFSGVLNKFSNPISISTFGGLIAGNNGLTYSAATTSLGVTGPITFSGTPGAQVGGVGGNFGCTTAASGVGGCLSNTSFDIFNNKQNAIALGAGTVNSSAGNALYATATSTPTVTAPITYSGTLGQFISGISGAFGCTNASAGVTGCLTGTDYNTFNGKENVLSFTTPNIRTGNTINWVGLATTSQPASSNVLVSNGAAGVYGAATTTATCTGSTTCTVFTIFGNSPVTINSTGSGSSFAWPFTPINAISVATSSGLVITASSTIGDSTQGGGLTVSGGATTTGNMAILSSLVIGTSTGALSTVNGNNGNLFLYNTNTPGASPALVMGGNTGGDTDFWVGRQNNNDATGNDSLQVGAGLVPGTTPVMTWNYQGREGIASTSPSATLSVHANPTDLASNTTLFAIGSSTATATTTLFSIDNTGGITTNLSGSGFVKTSGAGSKLTVDTNTYLTTAVTSAVAGTGISVSGATGAVTFTNTGVTSNVAGTGISVSGATGAVTVTNTGVTSIVAGTNITVSGATGAVTINATGGGSSFGYPFTPSTDGNINTSATSTVVEGTARGIGLDVPVTSWYGLGGQTLAYASTTNQDTILGINAGGQNATTSSTVNGNTTIGFSAGSALTTGGNNTAIGATALSAVTTRTGNTAVGFAALKNGTGQSNSTAVGFNALAGGGGFNNTSLGASTASNILSTGAENTLVGSVSGNAISSGSDNTLLGYEAGNLITTGKDNIVIGSASTTANSNLTLGGQNIIIGANIAAPIAAGSNQLNIQNIIFGTSNGGIGSLVSSGNIGIGTTTPYAKFSVFGGGNYSAQALTTLFAVGSTTAGTATTTLFYVQSSGQVFAPKLTSTSAAQSTTICGAATGELIADSLVCASSARRYKYDITDAESTQALSDILALQPVSYYFKEDFNGALQSDPNYSRKQFGLIADDTIKVNKAFGKVENGTTTFEGITYGPGTPAGVDYDAVSAALVGAVKAQQAEINALKPITKQAEDNWQWAVMGLLVLWNIALTVRRKK